MDKKFEVTEEKYEELEYKYSHGLKKAVADIQNIADDFNNNSDREVIKEVSFRIKTLKSLREKCIRKQLTPDAAEDIAGIKIVVLFEDDIEYISNTIDNAFFVKSEDNYLIRQKENGYRGIHKTIVVETTVHGRQMRLPIEVQIKTALMDALWSMEHVVKYKNAHPDPKAGEIVKKAAKSVAKLEQDMIKFRDYVPEETTDDNKKPAN